MYPTFTLACLQALLWGPVPLGCPLSLGPLKSPDCRSQTPAAGWRCGSSYPSWRRAEGGDAAEPGPARGSLGAGGAGSAQSASFSHFRPSRVQARRRPRPCLQLRPPLLPGFLRLWRSLAFRPARPKWGRSRGQGGVRERERLGPGGVLPLQPIQASSLTGPWDETELPAQPPPLAAPPEPQPGLN